MSLGLICIIVGFVFSQDAADIPMIHGFIGLKIKLSRKASVLFFAMETWLPILPITVKNYYKALPPAALKLSPMVPYL